MKSLMPNLVAFLKVLDNHLAYVIWFLIFCIAFIMINGLSVSGAGWVLMVGLGVWAAAALAAFIDSQR